MRRNGGCLPQSLAEPAIVNNVHRELPFNRPHRPEVIDNLADMLFVLLDAFPLEESLARVYAGFQRVLRRFHWSIWHCKFPCCARAARAFARRKSRIVGVRWLSGRGQKSPASNTFVVQLT